MTSVNDIQEEFLAYLRQVFDGIEIVEQGIPDIKNVKRSESGKIHPYIAVQFGDPQQGFRKAMSGPEDDDYYLPIYMQFVADVPDTARQGANRLFAALIGKTFKPWGGSMRKKSGGNMFPIVTTDGATEAYQFPSSWALLVQFAIT